MPVVDIVKTGARRQMNTVVNFATAPVGVFETVDKMVRQARSTAQSVVSQRGVSRPDVLRRFRLLRRY